jgi:tetratricopeptide (TPR) repeat protein
VVKDDTLAYLLDVVFSEDFDIRDVGREDIDALILYKKAQTLEKKGKIEDALLMLESALKLVKDVSPVFSTNILLKKVKLLMEHRGVNYATVALLEELSERLSGTGADFLKGDVHFNLGNAYSSMGNLPEAIKHYWEALNFFTLDRDPYMYALINNNMGRRLPIHERQRY